MKSFFVASKQDTHYLFTYCYFQDRYELLICDYGQKPTIIIRELTVCSNLYILRIQLQRFSSIENVTFKQYEPNIEEPSFSIKDFLNLL